MAINPSTMRLGIVAIVVGLTGAYGVRWMMDEEEVVDAPPPQPKVVAVPLANADLPNDRPVRLGDIALVPMTQKVMEDRNLPLELVMLNADQIIGRIPRKMVRQGEPFLTTGMYLTGHEQDINDLLKPGFRAVNIQLPNTRGGTVKAGDVVDVMFRSKAQKASGPGKAGIPEMTIVLLQAVDVLKVTRPKLNALQATVGYNAKDPMVTLAVRPKGVQILQAVEPHGQLSLSIRSPSDLLAKSTDLESTNLKEILGITDPVEEPEEPVQAPPPPFVVEKYYRGSRGVEQFPKPGTPQQLLPEYRERIKMERMIAKIRDLQEQGLLPSDEELDRQRGGAAAGQAEQVAAGTVGDILPVPRRQQPLPQRNPMVAPRNPMVAPQPGPMGYPMTKDSGMGSSKKDMNMTDNPFTDDPMTLEVMP